VFFEGVSRVGLELSEKARPEWSNLVGWWSRPRGLGQVTGVPAALEPPFDGPERDHELVGDLSTRHPTVDRVDDPDPEILGIGLHIHSMPERATLQAKRCNRVTG
jgi:hypothetical protein